MTKVSDSGLVFLWIFSERLSSVQKSTYFFIVKDLCGEQGMCWGGSVPIYYPDLNTKCWDQYSVETGKGKPQGGILWPKGAITVKL